MNPSIPAPASSDAATTIRRRCNELGLPVWHADRTGEILGEPSETGLIGLWLRSEAVLNAVAGAARAWAAGDEPALTELTPGCWLVPIAETRRRRRVGFTIAMAFSRAATGSELFRAGCAAAQLDLNGARAAFTRFPDFDAGAARQAATTLGMMMRDLQGIHDDRSTVEGFTVQLSESYEAIDLLYSVGRSMQDLTKAEQFVGLLCDRLFAAMNFGWLTVVFPAHPRTPRQLDGRVIARGRPAFTDAQLSAAAVAFIAGRGPSAAPVIAGEFEGLRARDGSQILVQPIISEERPAGLLLFGDKTGADPQVSSYETQLTEAAAGYLGAFLANAGLYADQRAMFLGSLQALTSSIDAKDPYTCGHSERVAHLGARLAAAAGLSEADAERVHICGLVHDVGKIGVPESVLCKAGKLTDREFDLIKLHPEIGHRILRDIPHLGDILPGVLHHHERWDGRGYPHKISAGQIPFYARLLGLADTFDAMSSTRSYRAAMPRDKVLAEIERCAGAQFDPALVPLFTALDFAHYDAMVENHARDKPVQLVPA